MELILPYAHNSERANACVADGKKVFMLALPRSDRRPEITERSEAEAQQAAAKLCQTRGLKIEQVWFEDGVHDDLGWYRMFYMVMSKAH